MATYLEPVRCQTCGEPSTVPGGTIDFKKLISREKTAKCCHNPRYYYIEDPNWFDQEMM